VYVLLNPYESACCRLETIGVTTLRGKEQTKDTKDNDSPNTKQKKTNTMKKPAASIAHRGQMSQKKKELPSSQEVLFSPSPPRTPPTP